MYRHNGSDESAHGEVVVGRNRTSQVQLLSTGIVTVGDETKKRDSKVEPNVIAVPGYHTRPVSTWGLPEEFEQAAASTPSISRLHMYMYQSNFEPAGDFTWESFLETGSDLAEQLARLATEFPRRPIIFVAHSLGGVLLKKALQLAHDNPQDPRFRIVLECLSGILFMSTPHAADTDPDTFLRMNRVLYSCARVSVQKKESRLPANDVFQLANLAVTFEQIANIPILSVFENAAPRTAVPRFFNRKVLVDERLATISSQAEQLLGVNLPHNEVCMLPKLRKETDSAQEFLRSLLEELADDQRWTMSLSTSQANRYNPVNPLNPLNLVSPQPRKARGTPGSDINIHLDNDKPAPSTSLELPLRLQSLSDAKGGHLANTKSCSLPCFMVSPYRNYDFVGRQDTLELMDKHLLPRSMPEGGKEQTTRLFALCGMGGIGKTDLAVEYAHSRREKYGAIFWVEAGGISQLASEFARIATALGLQSPEDADSLESSIEIAKAWLEAPRSTKPGTNDNWLLIFDNADNIDILTHYMPYNANGSVLLTSRDPFAKEHFFNNESGIDMEPLAVAESADLLQRLIAKPNTTESSDEKEAAIELAGYLDNLPLAMTQMAGFIRRRHLLIREFVNLFANNARYGEIHGIGNPMQQRRYGNTLATAFNFDTLTPQAKNLVQILSFLNPDRVQEYIFVHSSQRNEMSLAWKASDFENARFDLISCSLVKRTIDRKSLWLHRVIQAEVRTRMDTERDCYKAFMDAVTLLYEVWPPGDACSQKVQRWSVCEELLPHLERLYQMYIENSANWRAFGVDIIFPTLLNEGAVYLHERGFSHEGKSYLRLALSLCEQENITEEPLVSDMHLSMGALANETNDAQACLEHNILCLTRRQEEAAKGKAPDLRLAFAHSQMGIAYMMVQKFALATEYFKQSVEMLKSIDVDPDEFGFPVCNLGLAYWIQGELEQADATLTDLLAQREKLHGKLDRISYKTGRVLQALGNVRASKAERLASQGKLELAETMWSKSFRIHQDCLKQYESTLGNFNHRTADACHKLAEHYIRMHEDTLAQDFLDRALSIWGDRQWFRNESARSSFLRGKHLISMCDEESVELGNRWIERAKVLRREILPNEEGSRELDTADFDALVCFWSI
ncbi:tetratricopeptide repeat domain-containing protein [Colletotrichum sublineola]|nr:tetratricopeptide repeat domain-containing protein [Colletotrichum sublineola]